MRESFLPGLGRLDPFRACQMHPLALAYLGDAVFELYVRDRLLTGVALPTAELHRQAVMRVQATSQAAALRAFLEQLTKEEADVVRRARNARCSSYRHGDPADYHYSTAFEALLGYLYLLGRQERLEQLMNTAFELADRQEDRGEP
ncbi:MAG: Mini-ribonuclease 3 [Limnochordia bacterium]|jgi:ribonuclease-3 family protein